MFRNGIDIPINVSILHNENEILQCLGTGGKIIMVTEDVPDFVRHPLYGTSALSAVCLLPQYNSISSYIDGDLQDFAASYMEYLSTPDNTMYFASILSAIVSSIPMGFIFGKEEIEVAATNVFLEYFMARYGICIDPMGQSYMQREYIPTILNVLFDYNLISGSEFLYIYPENVQIGPQQLQKLAYIMPPIPGTINTDFNYLQNYFMEVVRDSKKFNKPLIDPFGRPSI